MRMPCVKMERRLVEATSEPNGEVLFATPRAIGGKPGLQNLCETCRVPGSITGKQANGQIPQASLSRYTQWHLIGDVIRESFGCALEVQHRADLCKARSLKSSNITL